MSYALKQIPLKRTRQVRLTGNSIEKMRQDVTSWPADAVRNSLRKFSVKVIGAQIDLGNEPSEMVVDGTATKPVTQANKVVYVRFGQRLNKGVIRQVELTLARNIKKDTRTVSGKLSNVRSNWHWLLYDRKEGGKAKPVNPYSSEFTSFKPGQMLLLVPRGVVNDDGNYAGSANSAKKNGTGFLRKTTKSLNRSPKFRNFYYARVGTTVRFKESRELSKYGTRYISITPRLRFKKSEIR